MDRGEGPGVLILGIESATSQVGCAVGGPDGVIASVHTVRPRHHAESLAPQIEFVIGQAGIEIGEIGAVAVDIGPGLFTGLRVGITTAISVAFALAVPMISANSLELLAFGVATTDREIHAMIDARRGEIFHASFRSSSDGIESLTPPTVALPDDLARSFGSARSSLLLVGDGVRRHVDSFQGTDLVEIAAEGFDQPSASSLVRMARGAVDRGEFVTTEDIRPLYLREPDAKANWAGTTTSR